MPRDLRLVRDADALPEGSVTMIGRLEYLGPENVCVIVCEKPLRRRWFPRSCVVSPVGFDVIDVTLEVPVAMAVELGLVSRHSLPPLNPPRDRRDRMQL